LATPVFWNLHPPDEVDMSFTIVENAPARLNRSELAVPGSNPKLFEKAAASDADIVFLDLEDAVAPDDKPQARKNVVEAINDVDWGNMILSLRINGLDTHYMYRDVVDVLEQTGERLDLIMIPKVGTEADVYAVDMLVTQIEQAKGRKKRIGFELIIETALGMANIDAIEDRLLEVNDKLLEKARASSNKATIGSTVVIMLAFDKYCIYVWAGDSRLYRLRNNELRQITTDHSQVELYVEQGLITREEALYHPHSNMITRAIGATDELFLDMDMQEMERNDRYLLCSDGLTKHILDYELENMLKEGSAEDVGRKLIDTTLERGAGDNVTVIIVDIE